MRGWEGGPRGTRYICTFVQICTQLIDFVVQQKLTKP